MIKISKSANVRKNKKLLNIEKIFIYFILVLTLWGWSVKYPRIPLTDLNFLLIVAQSAGLIYAYSRNRIITKTQLLISGMFLLISLGLCLLVWNWSKFTPLTMVLLPVMTVHLGMVYPQIKSWYRHYGFFGLKVLYLLGLLILIAEFLVVVGVLKTSLTPMNLGTLNLSCWGLVLLVLTGGWFFQYFRNKAVLFRRKLQYLLWGLLLSTAAGLTIYLWEKFEWSWIIFIPGFYFAYLATSPGHQSSPTRSILVKLLSGILTFLISLSLCLIPVKLYSLPLIIVFLYGALFASMIVFFYPQVENFFDRLLFGPRRQRVTKVAEFIDELYHYTEFSRLTGQFTSTIRKFTDAQYCILLLRKQDDFEVQISDGEVSIPSQFSFNCHQPQGIINYIESVARTVIIDQEDFNVGFREISVEDKVYLSKINTQWIFPLYLGKTLWGLVLGAGMNKPLDKWYQDKLIQLACLVVPMMNLLKESQVRLQTQVELQQKEYQRYLISKVEQMNKAVKFKNLIFQKVTLIGADPGNLVNIVQISDGNFIAGNLHGKDGMDSIIQILGLNNLLDKTFDFSQFNPLELFKSEKLVLDDYALVAGDESGFKLWSSGQGCCFGIYSHGVEKIEGKWYQFNSRLNKLVLFSKEVYHLKNVRHQNLSDDIIYSGLVEINWKDRKPIEKIRELLLNFTANSNVESDVKILTITLCQN
ncbi:MAG: hypothetical protein APR63_06420 [Desulfuromonas sp. SDB]|nr:MAG: hypothetical protein APR63_06420 [Desulfuromonas sp. SDB]